MLRPGLYYSDALTSNSDNVLEGNLKSGMKSFPDLVTLCCALCTSAFGPLAPGRELTGVFSLHSRRELHVSDVNRAASWTF